MANIPMKEIPTFEELEMSDKFDDYGQMARWYCKQYVKAALKTAYDNASFTTDKGVTMKFSEGFADLNRDSILLAYPDNLIQ